VNWKPHVETDPRYFRPTEVDFLRGDATKIQKKLGWKPKVSFEELVCQMVEHDLELARQERTLAAAGHKVVVRGVSHG
jgi:GDPmannose 4,6-dehydratase